MAVDRKAWEYAVEPLDANDGSESIQDELDDYGKDGWELVGFCAGQIAGTFRAVFKRPALPQSIGEAP